ncbi:cyclic nucleotide-binding domain-containing protein [Actinomadura madurae]|uniref:cyclic nucleotide-binding domain-containing protein n=1 Tax=Actinomadura madurae TaxID=1993 RepID=UPI0020D20D95|nr:cyclic nucleotide-binding domain-containing protein [Actinomadura madurae]MCQ0015905.1 cyclic nucleotide-binding domain-containing protein [Actinomadura madurae]
MDVSERTWKLLVAAGAERRFGAGDVLLRQGDPATHVLLLAAGRVKALMTLPDGQVLLLAVRGPGELLAEIAALGGRVAPAGDAAPARGEAWRAEAAPPAGPRVVRALLRLAVPRGGRTARRGPRPGRRSARRWDGVLAVLPLDAARSLIDPFPRRLQEALAPAAPSLRGKGVRLRLRVALRIGLVDDERPDAPGILVELLLPEWRRLLPRLQVGLRRAAGG